MILMDRTVTLFIGKMFQGNGNNPFKHFIEYKVVENAYLVFIIFQRMIQTSCHTDHIRLRDI